MNSPVKLEKQYYRGLNRNKWRFFFQVSIFTSLRKRIQSFFLSWWRRAVLRSLCRNREYDKTYLLGRQTFCKEIQCFPCKSLNWTINNKIPDYILPFPYFWQGKLRRKRDGVDSFFCSYLRKKCLFLLSPQRIQLFVCYLLFLVILRNESVCL